MPGFRALLYLGDALHRETGYGLAVKAALLSTPLR